MKKNVASQSIGAEMITAADGTAFTGTVTVLITIDNGTQSASGGTAPAHEGNGYHSYTPTQAETNGDHIAFTFTGSGAVPATVQVFTSFPQAVDNNVLAAGAAGFAAIDTVVDAILVDTGTTIPASITALNDVAATDIVSAGAITTSSGAVSTVTTCTTTTTNTDMRGTDSAGTAAELAKVPKSDSTVSWNATALGAINAECDTALTDYDGPTNTEMEARTLVAASYFDPTADAVANVTLVATTTTNTDMRGTDSANTVVPPSVAQFDARTILAASYFDPATDAVANVTLCATTTTNTDMRGTNSALLASDINLTAGAVDTVTTCTTTTTNTDMVAEPTTLLTTQMAEAYAADNVAPTVAQALFLIQQTIGDFAIAGTTITTKKIDGSTTAATYTLDDGTNPTSRTRAT